jgi:hypothetical protein
MSRIIGVKVASLGSSQTSSQRSGLLKWPLSLNTIGSANAAKGWPTQW